MRWRTLILILVGLCSAAVRTSQSDGETRPLVLHARLADEAITPVTARYVARALREAEETGAVCLILELDTPGGLMQATQQIVRAILTSPVPVVVYVAPPGARAASAGVFITQAAHVAAMAPGTHIGAAHPVSLGGTAPAPPDTASSRGGVMEEKVVNDAAAWARSLAELRGRNADWAAAAVTESRSVTAEEARGLNVIDLIVDGLDALPAHLDGRSVRIGREELRLHTRTATIQSLPMWWGERVLGILANPNIAFLLLMLGFYGILFEFYTPGWGVGGTLGAISLILAFFSLAVLPVNVAGLVLIALGLGLFVAEAFFVSFGALTLGGVVCLVFGGLMLVDAPVAALRVSAWVVVPVALATAAIAVFVVGSVVKAHRRKVRTGSEQMIGQRAVVREGFVEKEGQHRGLVWAHGELWRAVSDTPLAVGDAVRIVGRQGLTLFVEAVAEERPAPSATG